MVEEQPTKKKNPAMSAEEYLRDRVDHQIAWYDRKSASNKKGFIGFQVITLLASTSIPVFSIVSDVMWARVLVAILGSATAVRPSWDAHSTINSPV